MKTKIKKVWEKIIKYFKNIDKKNIIIFLIPLLMFGIYWVVFYPGVLSYDSYNQLQQIEAMTFNSSHPFFHTFIEMILMRIWNTPAVIGLFQILVFSTLWTSICKYNRKKKDSKVLFYAQILLTIFISLNPLNKVISITLWKDVLYSYMILWFCFELQKLIDKKFKIDLKEVIKLSFLLMVIPNLRHNGYIITLFMAVILFIILIIKDKKSFNYLKLLGFLVIFFFSFKGLASLYETEKTFDVSSTGSVVDYKLLNLAAEVGRDGKIKEEEETQLYKYIDYGILKVYGKYHMLDYVWTVCNVNGEAISKDHTNFYKLMINIVKNNVWVSSKFIMKETSFIWRIVRYDDSWGIINYTGINAPNTDKPYERPFANTTLFTALKNYVAFTKENVVFKTIFYSGSLCLYLSIAIIIYLKKKHKINEILILLPIILNLCGLVLTMPANDVRYYYSNFLVCYLLGAIFLKYWIKDEKAK